MTTAACAILAAFSLADFGLADSGAAGGGELCVGSRRCDFDRKGGVAFFEGAVRVDYSPGYTMCADRLFVFFEGTNGIGRIVAEGSVAVTNGTRVGGCDRAEFSRAAGMLEMHGGEAPARLAEPGANELLGRRIRFWLGAGQVEIDGTEITVDKGGRSAKDL